MAARNLSLALRIAAETAGEEGVKRLLKQIAGLEDVSEDVRQEAARLGKEMDRLGDQQQLITQFRKLKTESRDLGTRYKEAQTRVSELARQIASTTSPSKALTREFEAAKRSAQSLKTALEKQEAELQTLRQRMRTAGLSTQGLAKQQVRLRQEAANARAGVDRLQKSVAAYGTRSKQAQRTAADLGSALTGLKSSLDLVQGAFGTARRAVGEIVTEYATFDDRLRAAGAVMSATNSEMEALRDISKEMGVSTRFSATEAAGALEFLGRAGMTAATSIEALPPTLRLATVGQLQLADAADIVTNIMTGYGITVDRLPAIVDKLARASTSSNTSIRELGYAFSYAGPVASSTGQDFDEMTAVLGALGNAGIKGQRAGTALAGALSRLTKPTALAQGVLDDLGVTVGEGSGKLRSLVSILSDMDAAGATSADILRVFGEEVGRSMVSLTDRGTESIGGLTEAIRRSGGVSEEITRRLNEGLGGALAEFRSAANGAALALGDDFEPVVIATLDAVTELIRQVQDLPGPIRASLEAITLAGAGLAAWKLGLGRVVTAIPELIKGLGAQTAATAATATATAGLTRAMGRAGLAGAAVVSGVEIVKLTQILIDWYQEAQKAKASQELLADAQEKQHAALARLSQQLGINIESMGQFEALERAGIVRADEASGAWRLTTDAVTAQGAATAAAAGELAQYLSEHRPAIAAQERLAQATEGVEVAHDAFADALARVVGELQASEVTAREVKAALAELFHELDFSGAEQGFAGLSTAMQALREEAGASEQALREGLSGAVQDLAGKDLLALQESAELALAGIPGAAQTAQGELGAIGEGLVELGGKITDASAVVDATLVEALRRLGVEAQETGAGAAQAFDVVASSARATGEQIEQALVAALSKVDDPAALEQLLGALQQAGAEGKLTGEQLVRALGSVEVAASKLAGTLDNETTAAFKRLGVQTKAELGAAALQAGRDFEAIRASGQATADGLEKAFRGYAQAVIAANGGVVPATLEAQAAAQGYEQVLEALSKTGEKTGTRIADGMREAKDATDAAGKAAQDLKDQGTEAANANGASWRTLIDLMDSWRAKVESEYGPAAVELFERNRKAADAHGAFGESIHFWLERQTEAYNRTIEQLERERDSIESARNQAKHLFDDIADGTKRMDLSWEQQINIWESALERLERMRDGIDYVDQGDLSGITSQIEQVRQALDKARAAAQEQGDTAVTAIEGQHGALVGLADKYHVVGNELERIRSGLQDVVDETKMLRELQGVETELLELRDTTREVVVETEAAAQGYDDVRAAGEDAADAIRKEWYRLTDDQGAADRRVHEERLQAIREWRDAATGAERERAREAVALAKQVEARRLELAKQAAREAKREAKRRAAQQAQEQLEQQELAFRDLYRALEEEALQRDGRERELEDRRHQKALADLKAQAIAAGQYRRESYEQAVAWLEQEHAANLARIDAAAAREREAQARAHAEAMAQVAERTNAAVAGETQVRKEREATAKVEAEAREAMRTAEAGAADEAERLSLAVGTGASAMREMATASRDASAAMAEQRRLMEEQAREAERIAKAEKERIAAIREGDLARTLGPGEATRIISGVEKLLPEEVRTPSLEDQVRALSADEQRALLARVQGLREQAGQAARQGVDVREGQRQLTRIQEALLPFIDAANEVDRARVQAQAAAGRLPEQQRGLAQQATIAEAGGGADLGTLTLATPTGTAQVSPRDDESARVLEALARAQQANLG